MASAIRSARLSWKSWSQYVALAVVMAGAPGFVSAQTRYRYKACPAAASPVGAYLSKIYIDPDDTIPFILNFLFDGHTGTFSGIAGSNAGPYDFSQDAPKTSSSNGLYTFNFVLESATAGATCEDQFVIVLPSGDSSWVDATSWFNESGTPEVIYSADDIDQECDGGSTGGGGDPESVAPARRGASALDACSGGGSSTDYSYCVVEVEADANGTIVLDSSGNPIVIDVLYCEGAT